MILSITNSPRIIRLPIGAVQAAVGFRMKGATLAGLASVLAALAVLYAILVILAMSGAYQAKSLKTAINASENELTRNQSRAVAYLKLANPAVLESLKAMQDAAAAVTYVHTHAAIVDASYPRP